MKKNNGFTLVELIIVIAILAIIMLIAIPNFTGIQQRFQVRADKATAAQIGKAIRVWYTDTMADPALKATRAASITALTATATSSAPIPYDTITGIEGYMSKGSYPKSLRGTETGKEGQTVPVQGFGVLLSGGSTGAKVIVAIGALNDDKNSWTVGEGASKGYVTNSITGVAVTGEARFTYSATYDGNGAGVAYVEP